MSDLEDLYESEWFLARPAVVQATLRAFPPGEIWNVRGKQAWVVGAAEDDATEDDPPMVLFTYTDPNFDYDKAVTESFPVHQKCLVRYDERTDDS